MLLDFFKNLEILSKISFVPFCLPKKVPKKGTRNRYTARFREGAILTFSSSVASSSVILFLGSNYQIFFKNLLIAAIVLMAQYVK